VLNSLTDAAWGIRLHCSAEQRSTPAEALN
jgi:hypothetical protein